MPPAYDLVCLDCDSTLTMIEGFDELARRAGCLEEIALLTRTVMADSRDFASIYAYRLALLQPDCDSIDWLAQLYCERLTPGAGELIRELQAAGVEVHIISGGILQALHPLAAKLGLPEPQLHAVELRFDSAGRYIDYDQDSPLCRAGGKAEVCHRLIDQGRRAVMIGDGVTDLETMAAGVDFIGFGGVIRRPIIAAEAPLYYDRPDMYGLLEYLLPDAHGP